MAGRRLELNEWLFAVDAARGLPQCELAKRHDISRPTAGRILRGDSRPHVARLVAELRRQPDAHTRLRLAALQGKAMKVLESALDGPQENPNPGGGTGEQDGEAEAPKESREVSALSLSAAKEVLSRTLGKDWSPAMPEASAAPELPGRDILDLSPETQRRIREELGGPLD